MGYDKNLKLEPKQNALVVWAHFKEAMTVVLMCVSLTHVCAQHRTVRISLIYFLSLQEVYDAVKLGGFS